MRYLKIRGALPQQAHDPGLENIMAGEIIYDPAPNGQHRVRYRTLGGIKKPVFTGSPDEAWVIYCEWVDDLRAEVRRRLGLEEL